MNDATRRLFFALWPTDTQRHVLAQHASALLKPFKSRPVPNDNLHVTLAFLGAVPVAQVPVLNKLASALQVGECEIQFDRVEVWRKARVLALTATQIPPALIEFVSALQASLREHGFMVEERPYRAHITLARDLRADSQELVITPIYWPVKEFVLVESTTTSHGSHYEVIGRFI